MPRVKLAEEQYKNNDLAKLIRRYKYGEGLNNTQVGALIGVGERTFARYLENPGLMSLATLRKLQKGLKIPKEEIMQFIL